jgi:uncharacterized Zn-binding protein involved in type VI secretion
MPAAARTTDMLTPHSPCPPGKCGMGSNNVIIEGKLAYRVTDVTFPHSIYVGSPPSCIPHVTPLVQGSSNVYVNGKQLGRVNDSHSCGIKVATGAQKVIVNG